MKTNSSLIVLLILLVGAACSSKQDTAPVEQEEIVKTVNVATESIYPSTFASYVRVIGTVETSNDIMLSAEVSGKVVSYAVKEGAQVKKGATILRIDDSKLVQEQARLQAMTQQAKENYERLKRIYEQDGIGSELDYLNAKYNYQQINSSLRSINIDLANTNIKAPIAGRLEKKMVDVGEMVSPGMPVVRLIAQDDFIISAGVPARYANSVKAGDEVAVWFDTQASDTLYGQISYAANSINPENRTFRAEFKLPPSNYEYKVDMIANMRLKTYQRTNVIVISEEFIYSDENGYVVYVHGVDSEGRSTAVEKKVELGLSYQSKVIVEKGLEIGDELITLGSAFLDNGTKIKLVDNQSNNLVYN